MHIVILDDYQDVVHTLPCFSKLQGHDVTIFTKTHEHVSVVERLIDADAVVLIRERTRITAELLAQLPKLKLISQTGKISNHLDLEACTRYGVAVAEGVGSPIAPAELCWALILAAQRRLLPYCRNLRAGYWQQSGIVGMGRSLHGQTLGIWGYGKIGKIVAGYGRAFGMKVQIWGRAASLEAARADGYIAAPDKATFFASSDVLSLHLRLVNATRGIVKRADLDLMQRDALFVNISRAELIERGALVSALKAGRPGFAAVDVYEQEPLAPDHPFLHMENVLCSPHIGYVEQASYDLYFNAAFDNIVAWANGTPQNIANPNVITKQAF